MAAGAALVDADREVAHPGDPLGDLLAEQHAAPARLGALADDDLDRVGPAQIVGVHAVARRQDLIDQGLGRAPFFLGHPAVAGGRAGAHRGAGPADRLLGVGAERAEAHPRHGDRDRKLDRPGGEAVAEHHAGVAALAIAFQRVARHRCAKEQEVVEARQMALGAETADLVDALVGGAVDFGQHVVREGGGRAQRAAVDAHR